MEKQSVLPSRLITSLGSQILLWVLLLFPSLRSSPLRYRRQNQLLRLNLQKHRFLLVGILFLNTMNVLLATSPVKYFKIAAVNLIILRLIWASILPAYLGVPVPILNPTKK